MESEDNSDSGKEEEDDDEKARINEMLATHKSYMQMCQTSAKILQVLTGYVGDPQSTHIIELESVSDDSEDVSSCSSPASSSQISNNEEGSRPASGESPECVIWAEPLLSCRLVGPEPPQTCRDVRRLPPGVTPEDVKRSKAQAALARASVVTAVAGTSTGASGSGQQKRRTAHGPGPLRGRFTTRRPASGKEVQLSPGGVSIGGVDALGKSSALDTSSNSGKDLVVSTAASVASVATCTNSPIASNPSGKGLTATSVASSLATTQEGFKATMSQISCASETIRQAHSLLKSMGLGHYSAMRRGMIQVNNNNNPAADGASGDEAADTKTDKGPATSAIKSKERPGDGPQAESLHMAVGKETMKLGVGKSDMATETETLFPPLIVVKPANSNEESDSPTENPFSGVSKEAKTPKTSEESVRVSAEPKASPRDVFKPAISSRYSMFNDASARRNQNVSANVHHYGELYRSASSSMRWSSHLQSKPPCQTSRIARFPRSYGPLIRHTHDALPVSNRTETSTTLADNLPEAFVSPVQQAAPSSGDTGASSAGSRAPSQARSVKVANKLNQTSTGSKDTTAEISVCGNTTTKARGAKYIITKEAVKRAVDIALRSIQRSGGWTSVIKDAHAEGCNQDTKVEDVKSETTDKALNIQDDKDRTSTGIEKIQMRCNSSVKDNEAHPTNEPQEKCGSETANVALIKSPQYEMSTVKRVTFSNKQTLITHEPSDTDETVVMVLTCDSSCDDQNEDLDSLATQQLSATPTLTSDSSVEALTDTKESLPTTAQKSPDDADCDIGVDNQCPENQCSSETLSLTGDADFVDDMMESSLTDPSLSEQIGDRLEGRVHTSLDQSLDTCDSGGISHAERALEMCKDSMAEHITYGTKEKDLPRHTSHVSKQTLLIKQAEETLCKENVVDGNTPVANKTKNEHAEKDIETLSPHAMEETLCPETYKEKVEVSYEIQVPVKLASNQKGIPHVAELKAFCCDNCTNQLTNDNQQQIYSGHGDGDMTLVYDAQKCEWVANMSGDVVDEKPSPPVKYGGKKATTVIGYVTDDGKHDIQRPDQSSGDTVALEIKRNEKIDHLGKTDGPSTTAPTAEQAYDVDHFLVLIDSCEETTTSPAQIKKENMQAGSSRSEDVPAEEAAGAQPVVIVDSSVDKPKGCNVLHYHTEVTSFVDGHSAETMTDTKTHDDTPYKCRPKETNLDPSEPEPRPQSESSDPSDPSSTCMPEPPLYTPTMIVDATRDQLLRLNHRLSTGDMTSKDEADNEALSTGNVGDCSSPPPIRCVSSQTEVTSLPRLKAGRHVGLGKYHRPQARRPGSSPAGLAMRRPSVRDRSRPVSALAQTVVQQAKISEAGLTRSSPCDLRPTSPVRSRKVADVKDSAEQRSSESSTVSVIDLLTENPPQELRLREPSLTPTPGRTLSDAWTKSRPEVEQEEPEKGTKVKTVGESSCGDSEGDRNYLKSPPAQMSGLVGRRRRLRFRLRRRRRRPRSRGWFSRGLRWVRTRVRRLFSPCMKK